jgi:hypothetical protein
MISPSWATTIPSAAASASSCKRTTDSCTVCFSIKAAAIPASITSNVTPATASAIVALSMKDG